MGGIIILTALSINFMCAIRTRDVVIPCARNKAWGIS